MFPLSPDRGWPLSTITTPTAAQFRPTLAADEAGFLGIPTAAWAKAGVVAGLFCCVFWMNLRRLWLKTNLFTGEANWQHSTLVPLVGLYYLFVNRDALRAAGVREFVWGRFARPSRLWAGLALLAVGAAVAVVGSLIDGEFRTYVVVGGKGLAGLGVLVLALDWSLAWTLAGLFVFAYGYLLAHNDFLTDAGMVVTLFGVTLMLCGPAAMRTAWFPVVFLFCALPWPPLLYSRLAEPLQQMAATVAVEVLKVTGVQAVTSGTQIVIYSGLANTPPRRLNVAEACAGMRSLMTFISIAAALAFLGGRPLWAKLVMVASAVPIAIGCNVARISGQGLLDHYASPKWSESFAHQMVGTVMLIPAFLLILLVGWVLDHVFVEEADDGTAPAAGATAGVAKDVVVKPAVVAKAAAATVPPAVVSKPPVVVVKPATVVVKPSAAAPAVRVVPPTATVPPRPRTFTPPPSPAVRRPPPQGLPPSAVSHPEKK